MTSVPAHDAPSNALLLIQLCPANSSPTMYRKGIWRQGDSWTFVVPLLAVLLE